MARTDPVMDRPLTLAPASPSPPNTAWVSELLRDLLNAGRKGMLAEVKLVDGQLIVNVSSYFQAPEGEKLERVHSRLPREFFGKVEVNYRRGAVHTGKVLYSVSEAQYRNGEAQAAWRD